MNVHLDPLLHQAIGDLPTEDQVLEATASEHHVVILETTSQLDRQVRQRVVKTAASKPPPHSWQNSRAWDSLIAKAASATSVPGASTSIADFRDLTFTPDRQPIERSSRYSRPARPTHRHFFGDLVDQ